METVLRAARERQRFSPSRNIPDQVSAGQCFLQPFSPVQSILNPWLCSAIKSTRTETSIPAKNSAILVAYNSSDLCRSIFTQKEEYWNLVSFIPGRSFNY